MDDLAQKLDALLSSPDGLDRIGNMMAMLTDKTDPSPPVPDDSGLPDLSQLMKLLPLIGQLSGEDDNAALLKALRPHLSGERQKKLDEAGQWLKIAKLLPLIKDMKEASAHDDQPSSAGHTDTDPSKASRFAF